MIGSGNQLIDLPQIVVIGGQSSGKSSVFIGERERKIIFFI